MSYEVGLESRILQILKTKKDISSQKMFGGLCILDRGNMLCGIDKDKLMVRVGPHGKSQRCGITKSSKSSTPNCNRYPHTS